MTLEVMQQIHDDKKELYKKYIKNGALNTPLIEMLKGLKSRKWKIALVSAASKVNINNILEYFKITDVFDIIVGQEDVVETKPSPECYIKLCNTSMKYLQLVLCSKIQGQVLKQQWLQE